MSEKKITDEDVIAFKTSDSDKIKKEKANLGKPYIEFKKLFTVKCNTCGSDFCMVTFDCITNTNRFYHGFRCVSCNTAWHDPYNVEHKIEFLREKYKDEIKND